MENNKVDILLLSDFILFYFIKNEITINHLKLQKLLYYIQSWHMVYFNRHTLFDDVPEAWVNGPVYRKVYDKFKEAGNYNNFDLEEKYKDQIDLKFQEIKNDMNLNDEQLKFLDAIFKHYGIMSHDKLVYLTHNEEPWNIARNGLGPFDYSNNIISHDMMYEYYKNKLNPRMN